MSKPSELSFIAANIANVEGDDSHVATVTLSACNLVLKSGYAYDIISDILNGPEEFNELEADALFRTLMTDEGCELETAIALRECYLRLVEA